MRNKLGVKNQQLNQSRYSMEFKESKQSSKCTIKNVRRCWNLLLTFWVLLSLSIEINTVYTYLKSKYPANPLYYWIDSSKLESARWVAVIIRNLPPNCCPDKICKNWSTENEQVLYAEPPMLIKNCYWSLVRVATIHDAIKVCKRLNGKEIAKGKMLKVHIHPYSNYRTYDCQLDTKHNNDFLKQEAMFTSQLGISTVFNPESERSDEKPSKSPSSEILTLKDSKNLKGRYDEWKSQDVRRIDKTSTFANKGNSKVTNSVDLSEANNKWGHER